MLNPARVLQGNVLRYAELDEEPGEDLVPVINPAGNRVAFIGQGDAVILPHGDVAVFPELFHGNADGGLGHIQPRGDIHRTGMALLFQQHQNLLEIILR